MARRSLMLMDLLQSGRCAFDPCPVPATAKEAKKRWKTSRQGLNAEARKAFKKGSRWTKTKGGFPAIVSSDNKFAVAFRKDRRTQVVSGIDVGAILGGKA